MSGVSWDGESDGSDWDGSREAGGSADRKVADWLGVDCGVK